MPEGYEWGLWSSSNRFLLPHSHVYRRDVSLQAETTYHFQTRNLLPLTSANPDPVMYLVRGNEVVEFNDDYTGLASEIIYTPPEDGTHKLVIRAYATATPGFCDVYQGIGGAAPSLLDSNVMFGGTYVRVRWKQGEWFETGPGTVGGSGGAAGDPYLFLIYPEHAAGSQMYWDDDGAGSLHSKIVPATGGTGTILLGSYARYSDGECRLALVGQSYKAPWMSPAPWAHVDEEAPLTPTVTRYMEELERRKPALDELSPDERDQRVLELQRELLLEEEIRQQAPRLPAVSADLVRRQELFAERYKSWRRNSNRCRTPSVRRSSGTSSETRWGGSTRSRKHLCPETTSEGHKVPDQYDWDLWWGDEDYELPHTYVYRRDVSLQANTTYHFQTRNLRPQTWANPDPVMYLVRGNEIVEFNDDYTGLASEIIYTPPEDGTHKLVIRAYATATRGVCDLYQGVAGAAPSLLESNVMFGGTYVSVRWKQGEWFETGRGVVLYFDAGDVNVGWVSGGDPTDPYLFLIYPEHAAGSQMYWDDDGAEGLHSKIVPATGGTGTVIIGSYSRYSEGVCRLALVGQSYKAPWMSPAPWAHVAEEAPLTPTVAKYMEKLERHKPALDELSPDERDRQVLELQRRMLPEEEIRRLATRLPSVSSDLVRRQESFVERYKQMEKDLEQMSYDERAAKLAHVKRDSMGREYSEPEGICSQRTKRRTHSDSAATLTSPLLLWARLEVPRNALPAAK